MGKKLTNGEMFLSEDEIYELLPPKHGIIVELVKDNGKLLYRVYSGKPLSLETFESRELEQNKAGAIQLSGANNVLCLKKIKFERKGEDNARF